MGLGVSRSPRFTLLTLAEVSCTRSVVDERPAFVEVRIEAVVGGRRARARETDLGSVFLDVGGIYLVSIALGM
jgi:hypothetical protein